MLEIKARARPVTKLSRKVLGGRGWGLKTYNLTQTPLQSLLGDRNRTDFILASSFLWRLHLGPYLFDWNINDDQYHASDALKLSNMMDIIIIILIFPLIIKLVSANDWEYIPPFIM